MEENFTPIPEIPQEPPKPDYTARGRELQCQPGDLFEFVEDDDPWKR